MSQTGAFGYHFGMKLGVNPRGNGACPLCASSGDCRIHKLLGGGVERLGSGASAADGELELVIYSCPYFSEKVGS